MTDTYKDAPKHKAVVDEIDAEDKAAAEAPGVRGASARFRLVHGHLGEFIISEIKRDTPFEDMAGGLGSNVANAVVNLAMNGPRRISADRVALAFLLTLRNTVREQLDRLMAGDLYKREGIAIIEDGKLKDFDAAEELRHGKAADQG